MIKGLVTVTAGEVVTMLLSEGSENPSVGAYYALEDCVEGTSAQNRTFHALSMEYFKSGMHSYDCTSYGEFRDQIKRSLGAGFEGFVYIDTSVNKNRDGGAHYKMYDVKSVNEIPLYIREDKYMKDMIRGKLKSWSRYTKKQRKETIDNLITEMLAAGVNTKKFETILKGMKHESI